MENQLNRFSSVKNKIVSNYYELYYNRVHYRPDSLNKIATSYFHSKLELYTRHLSENSKIIEFGCGDFQHLEHIKHNFKHYVGVDIREPNNVKDLKLIQSFHDGLSKKKAFLTCDLNDIVQLDEKIGLHLMQFDRIFMTCILHHLPNAWEFLSFLNENMGNNATLDIFLPHDPSIFHRVYSRIFSEASCTRHGGSRDLYKLVHAIEHQNSFQSLQVQIKQIFKDKSVTRKQYPFGQFVPKTLNAFSIFHIKNNELTTYNK